MTVQHESIKWFGIALIIGISGTACGPGEPPHGGSASESAETGVALKPKHPTHKIVCECDCGNVTTVDGGDGRAVIETHDIPASGNCAELDGVECTLEGVPNKLQNCKNKSVRTAIEGAITGQDLELTQ